MSTSNVMNTFFTDVEVFLNENGLLDQPHRIYNIDETWDNPTQEKHQKVIVDKDMRVAYKVYGGTSEHITFTIGASADGAFLPPMLTFQSLPATNSFHDEGPENALYSESNSGHTDTDLYLAYIRHIEPYLSPERPVVIYQDNLGAHENLELIQFCVSKGIFLYNFPRKTTHLLQPMDKLFWKLKENIRIQKGKARLIHNTFITKAKIPLITRYAMQAMSRDDIKSAFSATGIFPLDRCKITQDKLIGERQPSVSPNAESPSDSTTTDSTGVAQTTGSVLMDVFDENGEDIAQISAVTKRSTTSQTDPIKSLPCSNCIENEVSLHPAVTEGYVDVAFAAAFIDAVPDASKPTKRRKVSRDTSKGRCLTHASEVERLTQLANEKKDMEEAVAMRKEAIEQRKKAKTDAEMLRKREKAELAKRK